MAAWPPRKAPDRSAARQMGGDAGAAVVEVEVDVVVAEVAEVVGAVVVVVVGVLGVAGLEPPAAEVVWPALFEDPPQPATARAVTVAMRRADDLMSTVSRRVRRAPARRGGVPVSSGSRCLQNRTCLRPVACRDARRQAAS